MAKKESSLSEEEFKKIKDEENEGELVKENSPNNNRGQEKKEKKFNLRKTAKYTAFCIIMLLLALNDDEYAEKDGLIRFETSFCLCAADPKGLLY